jgi:hypothetical protein
LNILESIRSVLGAKAFGKVSNQPQSDLEATERELSVSLPGELREVLVSFGAAVVFEKGAMFKPNQPTSMEDSEGLLSLDVLYGVASGDHGLRKQNATFRDQIGPALVAIGDAGGGDQVCLEKTSGRILFWYHEANTDEESLFEIAPDFVSFMQRLEPESDDSESAYRHIVKSESYLDF